MSDERERDKQADPKPRHLDTLVKIGPLVAVRRGAGLTFNPTQTSGPVKLHRAWSTDEKTLCGLDRSGLSDSSELDFGSGFQPYLVPLCETCGAVLSGRETGQP
ncbi:MAG: hypothetical protein WB383_07845 [Acidimicrobiales bacterium]